MTAQFTDMLGSIQNPATNKSMNEEGRIISAEAVNGELFVKYKRDGISPQEKRLIENLMIDRLKEFYSPEKISFSTVSENSDDVFKNLPKSGTGPAAKTAELKVGHGTVGTKKSVPNISKLIAVASGKGGVGKSTFTVNLAITLKNQGFKVGIIDADIYGPSVPMLLGKRDAKPKVNDDRKIIPIEAHGVKFMSFGLFIDEKDPVIWRGPMLGGVLNQFLFDVDWSGCDYVILDLPPGTGDIQLSMVQATNVDGAIIISTPQDVALLDAKKGFGMFRKVNVPIIGMVENMSSFICDGCGKNHEIFGHGGVSKAVEELETKFLGAIPLELELRLGSDNGIPYMSNPQFEGRPVWKAYNEIATKIKTSFEPVDVKKPGLFSFTKIFNK